MPRARRNRDSVSSRDLIPCHGCKYVYYCSKTCKEKAWDCHRKECYILKKFIDNPPSYCDLVLLVLRVIFKLKDKRLKDVTERIGDSHIDIGTLIASSTWQDHADIHSFLSLMRCALEPCLGVINMPESFYTIIITVERNRFDVQRIGTAFYIGASTLKRVCVPTTAYYFEGSTMFVKVIQPIYEDNSMLSISRFSFVDGYHVMTNTRALILDNCTCPECSDLKNSLLFRIIDDSTAASAIESSLNALDILHTALESGRKELNEYEKCCILTTLKEQEISLGACHFYRIRLLAAKVYFESDLRQKASDLLTLWQCTVHVFGRYSDQLIFILEQRFEVAEALGWTDEKKDLAVWYRNLCDLLYY
ncbi:N-lysine methyltransferase SMYD2-A-like [Stegodyphus dumicola]|uniref:N-lysine methyltransferase SMYD2-A-like n=1 Tax=Stegodyphus dumicola TaxID=202533 RepID=UPI0015A885D3|nr:N-lysine methyltransferase SMYD2-A-like [Stegodyphus dumicola]